MKVNCLKERVKKDVPEHVGLIMWLFRYRQIAFFIVKHLLLKTNITPNQVTYFEMITFLTSMVLVGTGEYIYMIIGAGLGISCVILDYIDGTLARAKSLSSTFGGFLDATTNLLEQIVIPISVTSAAYIQSGNNYLLIPGAIIIINTYMWSHARRRVPDPKILKLKIGLHTLREHDTRLFIFWLSCLFNCIFVALIYYLVWSSYEIIRMVFKYQNLRRQEQIEELKEYKTIEIHPKGGGRRKP